jgi:hypothetical protein
MKKKKKISKKKRENKNNQHITRKYVHTFLQYNSDCM